jgi:hypothetical protein
MTDSVVVANPEFDSTESLRKNVFASWTGLALESGSSVGETAGMEGKGQGYLTACIVGNDATEGPGTEFTNISTIFLSFFYLFSKSLLNSF